MRVGISAYCTKCRRQKCPRGRSAPMELVMCSPHSGCDGYYEDPKVGDLWPRETEEDFGYPCGSDGTKELEDRDDHC